MIELQKLRYFIAVAETLNIGRAATQLHISQSPLSRQIIALEEQLGTPLFSREHRRFQLTEAGRQLLEDAKELIAHALQIETRVRDEAEGKIGTLTLGFVEGAIHVGALQTAIKRFLRIAPLARVELKNLRSRKQFEALQLGGIDVGFTYAPPTGNSSLVCERIADEGFILAIQRIRLSLCRQTLHAWSKSAVRLGNVTRADVRTPSIRGKSELSWETS